MENMVFIVTCYQNIVGVYASQEDATLVANGFIAKGRIADVICRPVLTSNIKKDE